MTFDAVTLVPTEWWQPSRLVPVPEWKTDVLVKPMVWAERLNYLTLTFGSTGSDPDWTQTGPLVLIACCHTPEGKRLFRLEDAPRIAKMRPGVVQRLVRVAMQVSRIEDNTRAEEVAYLRLLEDGEFRLAMDLAFKWRMPLSELAARMPSYELPLWKAFLALRSFEMQNPSSGGSSSAQGAAAAAGFAPWGGGTSG